MPSDPALLVAALLIGSLGILFATFTGLVVRQWARTETWLERRLGEPPISPWFGRIVTGMEWTELLRVASKDPAALPFYIWCYRLIGVSALIAACVLAAKAW